MVPGCFRVGRSLNKVDIVSERARQARWRDADYVVWICCLGASVNGTERGERGEPFGEKQAVR